MKSVYIRNFSGPSFPSFGLNTERYGVSFRIQSKCGKMWTTKAPNTDNFYTVTLPGSDTYVNNQNFVMVLDWKIRTNFMTSKNIGLM